MSMTLSSTTPQKITTCLWFDGQAEEAANYYVSLFGHSRILSVSRYGEGAPVPAGTALMVSFELGGVQLQALNGGPGRPFTEAVSLSVRTTSQDETDRLWDELTSGGGEPGQCSWLKDRYGLSWQIVPEQMEGLLSDPDPERAQRAMAAMMTMTKIVVADIIAAADGR